MLSEKARLIIEATAPVVAERIPHITPEFYKHLLGAITADLGEAATTEVVEACPRSTG